MGLEEVGHQARERMSGNCKTRQEAGGFNERVGGGQRKKDTLRGREGKKRKAFVCQQLKLDRL